MTDETADQIVATCEEAFKAFPYVNVRKCNSLRGNGQKYVFMALSLDSKDSWYYKIFENSRYLKIMIDDHTGKGITIEALTCWNRKAWPRKATVKSLDKFSVKMDKIVTKILEKAEELALTGKP